MKKSKKFYNKYGASQRVQVKFGSLTAFRTRLFNGLIFKR